jgi:outer membrane biogenesis lipoprotein LolB
MSSAHVWTQEIDMKLFLIPLALLALAACTSAPSSTNSTSSTAQGGLTWDPDLKRHTRADGRVWPPQSSRPGR